jgi:hypothetical protein
LPSQKGETKKISVVLYDEIQVIGEQRALQIIRAWKRKLAKQRERYATSRKALKDLEGPDERTEA